MEDAEAEAVLLALGTQLEWRSMGVSESEIAITATGEYSVSFLTKTLRIIALIRSRNMSCLFGSYCTYFKPDPRKATDHKYRFYKSFDAAKAACERHHALRMQGNREGKWD